MPRPRASTVCTEPGCATVTHGGGRCPDCASEAAAIADRRRPNARQRGYDRDWAATRADYIDAHPWCEATNHHHNCDGHARHVDHQDGQGPNGQRGHDWANLQSLSHSCHSAKTNAEDGGGWPHRH